MSALSEGIKLFPNINKQFKGNYKPFEILQLCCVSKKYANLNKELLNLNINIQKNLEKLNKLKAAGNEENINVLNGVSRANQLDALEIYLSDLKLNYKSGLNAEKELCKIFCDLIKKIKDTTFNASLLTEQSKLIENIASLDKKIAALDSQMTDNPPQKRQKVATGYESSANSLELLQFRRDDVFSQLVNTH
tara:strand:- start:410 stop:985 length:576 start_codon:yes stop_codon:yes gene_type:complete